MTQALTMKRERPTEENALRASRWSRWTGDFPSDPHPSRGIEANPKSSQLRQTLADVLAENQDSRSAGTVPDRAAKARARTGERNRERIEATSSTAATPPRRSRFLVDRGAQPADRKALETSPTPSSAGTGRFRSISEEDFAMAPAAENRVRPPLRGDGTARLHDQAFEFLGRNQPGPNASPSGEKSRKAPRLRERKPEARRMARCPRIARRTAWRDGAWRLALADMSREEASAFAGNGLRHRECPGRTAENGRGCR